MASSTKTMAGHRKNWGMGPVAGLRFCQAVCSMEVPSYTSLDNMVKSSPMTLGHCGFHSVFRRLGLWKSEVCPSTMLGDHQTWTGFPSFQSNPQAHQGAPQVLAIASAKKTVLDMGPKSEALMPPKYHWGSELLWFPWQIDPFFTSYCTCCFIESAKNPYALSFFSHEDLGAYLITKNLVAYPRGIPGKSPQDQTQKGAV